jgi:hypothetical protein
VKVQQDEFSIGLGVEKRLLQVSRPDEGFVLGFGWRLIGQGGGLSRLGLGGWQSRQAPTAGDKCDYLTCTDSHVSQQVAIALTPNLTTFFAFSVAQFIQFYLPTKNQ